MGRRDAVRGCEPCYPVRVQNRAEPHNARRVAPQDRSCDSRVTSLRGFALYSCAGLRSEQDRVMTRIETQDRSAWGEVEFAAERARTLLRDAEARKRDAGTFGLDEHYTLADIFPPRKPSAQNGSHDRDEAGGAFTAGIKVSTVTEYVANYQLSEKAARLMELLTEDISLDTRTTRPRRRNHVEYGERVGDALEYERFRKGITTEQKFWQRRERVEHRKHGTITINHHIVQSSVERADSLQWRGAVCLALCDLLESLGYRVIVNATWQSRNIVARRSASNPDGRYSFAVTVKGEDERMSPNMQAVLSESGVIRTAFFRHIRAQPWASTSGLGMIENYTGSQVADIEIPRMFGTEREAIEFVNEIMAKYRPERAE